MFNTMRVSSKPRLLVAYSNAATHVSTTIEYLTSFRNHSGWEVSYLHVTDPAYIDIDLNEFDAIFHSYCARLCFPGFVSASYLAALKAFRGVRVLAVQDEYDRTDIVRQAIRDFGFHIILTCVPQPYLEFVYPASMFPGVEFMPVLTGYVPEALKASPADWLPLAQRPITIGYRGRQIFSRYGRLSFDKYEIGRRMREICSERGISHDIETTEESRIYGDGWYQFLSHCRTTLGSESGSNVFDFDGSLEATYHRLKAARGTDLDYKEFREYTDPREHEVEMGQISPRVFEAAALGTPMILFSGRYSGILTPNEHYIELKKDFSNIDEVLARIEDIGKLERLAERAYQHLIRSDKYDYAAFVKIVEAAIERKQQELGNIAGARLARAAARSDAGSDTEEIFRELPTPLPRDPIHLKYKQLCLQHQTLKRDLNFLQEEFVRETSRLNAEAALLRQERDALIWIGARGLWRVLAVLRAVSLRWEIVFGLPLSPKGVVKLFLRGVGAAMPMATSKITLFLLRAAVARRKFPQVQGAHKPLTRKARVLMVCAHEPKMDPRIGWEAGAAARAVDVTVLGFNREDGSEPETEAADGYRIIRRRRSDTEPSDYFWQLKDLLPVSTRGFMAAIAVMLWPIAALLEAAARIIALWTRIVTLLGRALGREQPRRRQFWNPDRIHFVLGNLRIQFGPAAQLFLAHIEAMREKPDVIHCNDLDTLLVGVLAKDRFGCRIVFDAHEFWPVADSLCTWIDTTFFSVLERFLIRYVDAVVTVNPMLAEEMRRAYRLARVYSVPNVEPWVEDRPRPRTRSAMAGLADGRIKFLFQGRFAPARGIDEIIRGWQLVDGQKSALFLRGPDNAWRQRAIRMAADLGLLERSIYFLDAVSEAELVAAAAEADVGIIPYLPLAINERLACPNKLSQYLHAGLMVLANDLPYVRSIIDEAQAGAWYDSADVTTFAAAVDRVASDLEWLRNCQRHALDFARRNFNWQSHGWVFIDLYAQAAGVTDELSQAGSDLQILRSRFGT